MRIFTYIQGADPRPGLAMNDVLGLDLMAAAPSLPGNWHALLPDLEPVRAVQAVHGPLVPEMAARLENSEPLPAPWFELAASRFLAPVLMPSKIVCVGLNYRDHAEEQNKPLPERPLLFCKATSCLQFPDGPIMLPKDLTRVDAEAELAVVIGRPGRRIARAEARQHIAGYTCFNDVSDREAQYADKQWFRGKSIDTGGPCGPWIVTPDELPDLAAGLDITCRWNGEVMQASNTEQLIFPVDALIEHISRNMTLLPGDIIATGTPGGVGVFRDPQIFLKPGDTVAVEIEGIGTLTNPVARWEP